MSAHTPGPWRTLENRGTPWDIEDANGLQVAQAQQQRPVRDDPKQISRHANARLIAAAPSLLSALKAMMVDAENRSNRDAAYEAIAKAEGREP